MTTPVVRIVSALHLPVASTAVMVTGELIVHDPV